jgi:outer membrane protein TolC
MSGLPLLFLASLAWAQPAPRIITLPEAYALSLKRSETLAQDRALVAEALARVDEITGHILPNLSFIGQHTFQQNPRSNVQAVNNTSIPNYYFQLQQPLFGGFREFMAVKSGKKKAEAYRLAVRRAESLLYQDVAQAYFTLEQIQSEIEVRGDVLKATADRIAQLERWVGIGRSRESEVLAARSQLAQLQAQVQLARGAERSSQEALRFLTGEDAEFKPQASPLPALEALEGYLERARAREDVRAAEFSLESAKLDVGVASRQRWGTLGVTGDYYLKRLGFAERVKWDAVFGLTIPIFDGGVIRSQTRAARARSESASQALSSARRTAEREARSAHETLQWALAAVDALRTASDLAARNQKAQEQDYKLSLITNIQVLDAITALQNARLQLAGALQQASLARARLDVAAGGPERP